MPNSENIFRIVALFHYESYIPWRYKISWARSLFHRAKKICTNIRLFKAQRNRISKIFSWNGSPSYVRKKMLDDFEESHERIKNQREVDQNPSTEDELSLTLKLPYMGSAGEKLVRTLKRKVQKICQRK